MLEALHETSEQVPVRIPKQPPSGSWLLPAGRWHWPRTAVVRALAAAAAAGLLVVLARAVGLLHGSWVLVLLVLLVLALPTARILSGRIAVTFSVFLGAVPLLWWLPTGFGWVGRGTFVLALAAAAVAGSVFLHRRAADGLRSLVPRVGLLDVLPALVGGLSLWVHFRLLTVNTYEQALSLLTMNWDNASHFDIFHMLRTHGMAIPLLGPAPDGSAWSFRDYPQGFHGTVAVLAELARSRDAGTAAAEVVNYANFGSLVSLATAVMVFAALASLPAFRRNPAWAFPVLTLAAAGWILGPGASASLQGFPNFFLATGLVAVAITTAVSMERILRLPQLCSLAACVLGVAHNWILLEVLVLGAVVVALLPWQKRRWRASKGEYLTAGAVFAVVAGGVALALGQVSRVSTDAVLYGIGGVPIPDFGQLLWVVLGICALYVWGFARTGTNAGAATRLRWSFLPLALGLGTGIAMGVAQLTQTGALTYYTHKLAIAVLLTALVVACLGVAGVLGRRRRRALRRPRAAAAAVLATVGATQAFGFPFALEDAGLPPTAEASVAAGKELKRLEAVPVAVEGLIKATDGNAGQPAVYLTTAPQEIDAILAKQWYDGLTGTYTERGWNLSLNMFALSGGVDSLRLVVNKVVKADPSAHIIVDPENQAALNHIMATLDE